MIREEEKNIIKERDSLKANPNVIIDYRLYEAFDSAIKAIDTIQQMLTKLKYSISAINECMVDYNEERLGIKPMTGHDYKQGYKDGYANGIKDGNINDGTFAEKVKEAYERGKKDGKADADGKYFEDGYKQGYEQHGKDFILDGERIREDALKTAIKALEQEPLDKTQMIDKSNFSQEQYKADLECAFDCGVASVKPCEDAISRKAVLDKIKVVCFSREQEWIDFRVSQGSNGQRDLIIRYIEDLPPIKPMQRTGHWIDTVSGQECSKCHEIQCGYDNHRFYCANCGARMVEPQESEDT